MPRKVKFEGKVLTFPDDATDQEVEAALAGGSVNITHKPYDPKRGARLNDRPAPLQPAGVPEGETADYMMGQASRSIRNLGTAALPAVAPYALSHPIATAVGGVSGGAVQQGVQGLGESLDRPGAGELGGDIAGAAAGLLTPKIPAVGAYKFLKHPKTAVSKMIVDAVLEGIGKGKNVDSMNPLDYMKSKPSENGGFEPFGSKPVLPPLTSDIQARLHALSPVDPTTVNITPRDALNTNVLPPRPPIWDIFPETVRPPTPPEFEPFGSKPLLPPLPKSTESVRPKSTTPKSIRINTNALPKSPPLWDMFPETVKPPSPPPAAQPATSPVQPQGPIQTPAPIPPVGEDMPQSPVMGGAEAHRYAHAQAQAAELPGSPSGVRAGAHDALTAIAKAKYGKNAWHELAPAQMQEIGDWLLDINMQRAQRAGQGIPPVK